MGTHVAQPSTRSIPSSEFENMKLLMLDDSDDREGEEAGMAPRAEGRNKVTRTVTLETPAGNGPKPRVVYASPTGGRVFCGDSLRLLRSRSVIAPGSVNLIMTSPPFGLVRKKEYGNVDADGYVKWFKKFGRAFYNALADNGSLVIDIGGAWVAGQPTRSLYHYKLLIMLCEEIGFHLAQEFFWWNPSRLPTPAEWVTVRRIRVKDAVNCIWWLSKTPWPKASNARVLQPYSPSMLELLEKGYKPKLRPSGHDISEKFSVDNGAAIPPNLIALANTESNSAYLRYCQEHNLPAHPARYPATLPEFFIRMLTDRGDLVVDPFGGSCVTGEAAERLGRQWICCELREDYVEGALGRFATVTTGGTGQGIDQPIVQPFLLDGASSSQNGHQAACMPVQLNENSDRFYKLPRPGLLWNGVDVAPLPANGGKTRMVIGKKNDAAVRDGGEVIGADCDEGNADE